MNLSLSSLFCCWGARKPNRSQTPPPDYDASERDALLGTGSRERTGEGSRAQANPQAGDANYQEVAVPSAADLVAGEYQPGL